MTQGEYVFIYPELIEAEALGNMSWSRGVGKLIILMLFELLKDSLITFLVS